MCSIELRTLFPIVMIVAIGLIFIFIYASYINSFIVDIVDGKLDIEIIDEEIYKNLSHVKIRKKIVKAISTVLFYGSIIVMTPMLIFAIVNRFQGKMAVIGDNGILAVASGSMSRRDKSNWYLDEYNLNNQFNTFDLIIVEVVNDDSELDTYDVISFINDKGENIIHRIVDKKTDEFGITRYTTRGDSNNEDDSFKPTINDIQGKYVNIRIPYLGALIIFLQSLLGIITIIVLTLLVIVFEKMQDKVENERTKRLNKLSGFNYKGEKNLNVTFKEKVYYKGYIYTFDNKGFVNKEKNVSSGEFYDDSQNKIIKVTEQDGKTPQINIIDLEKREM